MAHWADVVVGDYNYYFDRSAMLYALTVESALARERAGGRGAQPLQPGLRHVQRRTHAGRALALRPQVPASPPAGGRTAQPVATAAGRAATPGAGKPWHVLDALPEEWTRVLGKFNSAAGEYLNDHPTEPHAALLPAYFRTLAFAALAQEPGDHSLCEVDVTRPRPWPCPPVRCRWRWTPLRLTMTAPARAASRCATSCLRRSSRRASRRPTHWCCSLPR